LFQQLRVLQVADSLAVESGGTAASCAQLAVQLRRSGMDVAVLTCSANGGAPAWPLDPEIAVSNCPPAMPRRVGFCPRFRRTAASLSRPDVIHVHGLWRLHYWQAARYARALQIPSVVSLHGMLFRKALAEHGSQKRLARWLFQDRALRMAACLHATSASEIVEARRLGFPAPIALVPWGVDMPERAASAAAPRRSLAEGRTVLYFGRLHPRKGVDVLLRAWSRLGRRQADRLVIAGADPEGYRAALEALAIELAVNDSIVWVGVASGAERESLFERASVVVLPSAYENFGLVIAEALARGVPVIATQGAPWASLLEEECGWWIPAGLEPLAVALADALGRSDADLHAMGERGRRFARGRFRWECSATAMRELYEWLAGRRRQPAFVDR
jgi:glycosyltransferase involved in cell wall biosynthesis